MKVFQDPAILLAGIGSLLTRHPLTAAFGAAAGAMDGFQKGQKDVAEARRKEFEEGIQAAQAQNKKELDQYAVAWDRRKEFNWEKIAPQLYAQASANNDEIMKAAIQSGNWEMVEKILIGRETALS